MNDELSLVNSSRIINGRLNRLARKNKRLRTPQQRHIWKFERLKDLLESGGLPYGRKQYDYMLKKSQIGRNIFYENIKPSCERNVLTKEVGEYFTERLPKHGLLRHYSRANSGHSSPGIPYGELSSPFTSEIPTPRKKYSRIHTPSEKYEYNPGNTPPMRRIKPIKISSEEREILNLFKKHNI